MKGVNGMNDMDKKIRQAFENATPDVLDTVLSRCESQKGAVKPMKTTKKKSKILTIAAAAAIVVLLFGIGIVGARLLAPPTEPGPADTGVMYTPTDTTGDTTPTIPVQPAIFNEDTAKAYALTYAKEEFPLDEHASMRITDVYMDSTGYYEVLVESQNYMGFYRIENDGKTHGLKLVTKYDAGTGMVMIDSEEAIRIALAYAKFSRDQVTDLEAELMDNKLYWEVEFDCQKQEYLFIIDAYTGEVMYTNHSGNGNGNQHQQQNQLGNTQIKQVVLEHAGLADKDITLQIERDFDDAIPHYDVEFVYDGYEYDYKVDKYYQILSWEKEPVDGDDYRFKQYDDLFGDYSSYYNRAVGHTYDSPKELQLKKFFTSGFAGESQKPTDAEWAELEGKPGFNINYDLFRLPVDKMNAELRKYFGITLDDLSAKSFDGLVYLESTNCYYFMATAPDGVAEGFVADDVDQLSDGTFIVSYTLSYPAGKEFEVGFKRNGDGYIILFNRVEKDDDNEYDDDDREFDDDDVASWTPPVGMRSSADAITAALDIYGYTRSQVKELEWEVDTDARGTYYEISFEIGNKEYEIDIDAYTLKVLKTEVDIDD